jgi:hypothetical protein
MKQSTETVTVKVGEGTEAKEFSKTYVRNTAENIDDILKLLQDEKSAKTVISAFNYGSDLKARAAVRAEILNESAGPEKALAKLAADIMKLRASIGKPVTQEKANALAKLQMDAE